MHLCAEQIMKIACIQFIYYKNFDIITKIIF